MSIILLSGFIPYFAVAQAPALSDRDDGTYTGLYWGAAGISKTLSILKDFVSSNMQESLDGSISKAVDYIWNSRFELENGTKIPAWGKYKGLEIYPGQKYGAAGIIKAFTSIYQNSMDQQLLINAELAARELIAQAWNSSTIPNWAYAYAYPPTFEPVRITDIQFGNLGVIDAFLDLYEITGGEWLLDSIIKMYAWLDYTSRNRTIGEDSFKLLPWYNLDGNTPEFRSSYGEGNAGAVVVFLRLYEITGNVTYYNWAENITYALIRSQLSEGGWPFFIDNPGVNNRISWKDGSIGILHALIVADEYDIGGQNLDDCLSLGFEWLADQIHYEGDLLLIPEYTGEETGFTSHDRGLTGAFQVFIEYQSPKYSDLVINIAYAIISDVLEFKTYNGNKLFLSNVASTNADYSDLSLADGLAGIVLGLTDAYSELPQLFNETNFSKIITDVAHTFLELQKDDGSWQRQIKLQSSEKKSPVEIYPLFFGCITIIYFRSKQRASKFRSF